MRTSTTTSTSTTRATSRKRRLLAGVALGGLALSACSTERAPEQAIGGPSTNAPATTETPSSNAPVTTSDVAPVGLSEDELDATDDSGEASPPSPPAPEVPPKPDADDGEETDDDGGDDPVDLDPAGTSSGPDPACEHLAADGSSLVVGPDPLVLDDNAMTGTVSFINCSDGDVDWTASTVPSVALDDDAGLLLPGETEQIDFVIDEDQWGFGAIEFKIKVQEPGHPHYVDVHAFRQMVGDDMVADVGLANPGGPAGCSMQCITSVLLDSHFSTADITAAVTTNTAATVETYVLSNEPITIDGVPLLAGATPVDTSPAGVTSHLAQLSPLEPATAYHVVVAATDADGSVAYRIGEFTTVTPVEQPGQWAEPNASTGCAAGCITTATLSAGADPSIQLVEVTTDTTARFELSASKAPPRETADGPVIDDPDAQVASFGLRQNWQASLTGLSEGAAYHVVLTATDADGNVERRSGRFETPKLPQFGLWYDVVGVRIEDDGDDGVRGRGEIRLRWAVGENEVGTAPETKLDTGDWVGFPPSQRSFYVDGVRPDDLVPSMRIAAFERDADGRIEFCGGFAATPTFQGEHDDCDVVWSVGSNPLLRVDALDTLETCESYLEGSFSWANDLPCLVIRSGDVTPGYPEFTAYVAVTVG